MRNEKININIKQGMTFSEVLNRRKSIRRLYQMFKRIDCRYCGEACDGRCQAWAKDIKTMELELHGGKSEYVNQLDVSRGDEDSLPGEFFSSFEEECCPEEKPQVGVPAAVEGKSKDELVQGFMRCDNLQELRLQDKKITAVINAVDDKKV